MEPSKPISLAIIDSEDFADLDFPPKRDIVTPWLKESMIILVTGWRGVGKSWWVLSLLDSISKKIPFGPWETKNPVPSLYIDAEMAASDVQTRLALLSNGHRRELPIMIYCDSYANVLKMPRANLRSERWRKEIRQYLIDEGIGLVVLDNIASLCPGIDENNKRDWDPINQFLLELRFNEITSILLHHTNKTGDQRGTSAREDNIDISISLFQPSDYMIDQGARFIARFRKTRIATKDLAALQDIEFQLTESENRAEWSWKNIRRKNKVEILRLIDEGIQQADIASSLGVSKGFVSQVKAAAVKDGHLSIKGKLTQSGAVFVGTEGFENY